MPGAAHAVRFKILLAHHDQRSGKAVAAGFRRRPYSVRLCETGFDALEAAQSSHPDAIVLTTKLGGTDGLAVTRRLKSGPETDECAVIVLGEKGAPDSRQIAALDRGADAYVPHPHPPVLVEAVTRAILRRTADPALAERTLSTSALKVDLAGRLVTKKGKRIKLTRKEFDLLTLFARKPGRVLTIPYLLETVWDYDPASYNDPATVQAHVSALRRKLGQPFRRRIVAVQGLGYRFED